MICTRSGLSVVIMSIRIYNLKRLNHSKGKLTWFVRYIADIDASCKIKVEIEFKRLFSCLISLNDYQHFSSGGPNYSWNMLDKLFDIYTHAFLSIWESHPLPRKNAKMHLQPASYPTMNIRYTSSLLRISALFLRHYLNPSFCYERVKMWDDKLI